MSNFIQQMLRGHLIGTRRRRTDLQPLFQRRNPNFEELIQVGRRDTQESEALENGNFVVTGLLQNTLIELKEAELAVNVQIGRR